MFSCFHISLFRSLVLLRSNADKRLTLTRLNYFFKQKFTKKICSLMMIIIVMAFSLLFQLADQRCRSFMNTFFRLRSCSSNFLMVIVCKGFVLLTFDQLAEIHQHHISSGYSQPILNFISYIASIFSSSSNFNTLVSSVLFFLHLSIISPDCDDYF